MEHITFPTKLFSGIAIVAAITVSACTSNDYKTNETPVATADTSMPTNKVDEMAQPMPNNADTSKIATSDGTVAIAKPNPAKKGLKGKASINEADIDMKGGTTTDNMPDANGIYKKVDYIPSFPGGYKGMQAFFDKNLEYPTDAADQGVEATVRIGFTIDENGKLINPKIVGENNGYGLEQEALRVVNKMPTWVPGKTC